MNHEISKAGNIYFLASAFIGAINRLADKIGQGDNSAVNAKLDKIISLLEADPEALKLLAAKLKSSTDALDAAVKNQTTKP